MKKILLFFFITTWQLMAWDKESTIKLYSHLFHSMIQHETIKFYTQNREYAAVFAHAEHFVLVDNAEDADIVLITSKKEIEEIEHTILPQKTILFTTSYRLLKSNDDIVGAFYWRKGRSQLLFIRERLEKNNIHLPQSYHKYIISEL